MQALLTKRIQVLWAAVCALYILFVAVFSFLFPYGLNEYLYKPESLSGALRNYFFGYLHFTSRLGFLFTNIILYFGKWSFIIINPLIQLAIVFLSFFLVFMRWPMFDKTKDMYIFVLIAILTIVAVPVPGHTLFWISGSCTYRWVFLVFLCVLCLFRLIMEHEYTLPDNLATKVALLFAGFIVGMSNRSNGPMGAVVFISFFVYCKFKKIPTPSWFNWGFAGICTGLILLFAAPGPYRDLTTIAYEEFHKLSLGQKFRLHLSNINDFLYANLFLPVITFFCLLIGLWDKRRVAIHNIDFISSAVMWILSVLTAVLLFIVPSVPMRAFYCAAMFSIYSFIFIVKYLKGNYRINFYKYLAIAAVSVFAAVLPLFTLPYLQLYRDNNQRMAMIAQAKENEQNILWCNEIVPLKGPTANLSILFSDALYLRDKSKMQKYFGLTLKSNSEFTKNKRTAEII